MSESICDETIWLEHSLKHYTTMATIQEYKGLAEELKKELEQVTAVREPKYELRFEQYGVLEFKIEFSNYREALKAAKGMTEQIPADWERTGHMHHLDMYHDLYDRGAIVLMPSDIE